MMPLKRDSPPCRAAARNHCGRGFSPDAASRDAVGAESPSYSEADARHAPRALPASPPSSSPSPPPRPPRPSTPRSCARRSAPARVEVLIVPVARVVARREGAADRARRTRSRPCTERSSSMRHAPSTASGRARRRPHAVPRLLRSRTSCTRRCPRRCSRRSRSAPTSPRSSRTPRPRWRARPPTIAAQAKAPSVEHRRRPAPRRCGRGGSTARASSSRGRTRATSGTIRRCSAATAAGTGGGANHDYNWHDAIHAQVNPTGSSNPCGYERADPCDDDSHGTHTMGIHGRRRRRRERDRHGTAVRAGSAAATWTRAGAVPRLTSSASSGSLAPTDANGQNPDPALAPHVINNSWGCPGIEGCDAAQTALLEQAVGNLRTAGILFVVSAGNAGPGCGIDRRCAGDLPRVLHGRRRRRRAATSRASRAAGPSPPG